MSNDKYGFTQKNVNNAPEVHGVYALYDGDELIYIGRADGKGVTVRSRLQCHFRGDEGRCTQGATHYWRVGHNNPAAREVELLNDYKRRHGRLPRCNSRVG
jgi:hypothetical protein